MEDAIAEPVTPDQQFIALLVAFHHCGCGRDEADFSDAAPAVSLSLNWRMFHMRMSTGAVLLGLLLFAAPAVAQEQRASIEGTVKDNTGAVLPGVTVDAKNLTQGAWPARSRDAGGFFRFPSLAPGAYEVTAKLLGLHADDVLTRRAHARSDQEARVALGVSRPRPKTCRSRPNSRSSTSRAASAPTASRPTSS